MRSWAQAWAQAWASGLALALPALLLALPGTAQAQGLVKGVLGIAVSPAPGQPASQHLQGGLALLLNRADAAGQSWSQLLASDGRQGWTPQALGTEWPVTAKAPGPSFELMPLPPGHADFLGSQGQPVPAGSTGRLTGGSLGSYVADMQDNQVPPWLSHSVAAWPRWLMGGVEGYAPLPGMALSWHSVPAEAAVPGAPAPAGAGTTRPRELLGLWGLQGLSRGPFLAPLTPQLQPFAPKAGARALDLSGPIGQAAQPHQMQGAWQGPLTAYRAAAETPDGLSALLLFGQGPARALVLMGQQGLPMLAFADSDALSVAHLVEADLDRDGRPEWLLEMVGVYGDGYYSELWIVDGRSGLDGLRIHRMSLSRSSGEMPGGAQHAAWWPDAQGGLWVWRSSTKGGRLGTWRYARQGGPAAAPGSPALVVLGTDADAVAAGQRRLLAAASTPGAQVLPLQTTTGLRWVTALPAPSAARAARWARQQGLPPQAVQTLPWAL